MVLLLVATHAGCGGSNSIKPPKTVAVNGTVLLKDKPAAGVLVTFHPQFDIGPIRFQPLGETDKEGKFRLSTGAADNGAPPGEYVVTFAKLRIVSDRQNSGIETEVDDFKGKFSDASTSTWKVTIGPGTNALEPFRLE